MELGNIDLSSLTNIVSAIMGNTTTNTTSTAAKGAIIDPDASSSGKLTAEEQQIYELGEAEISKIIEDYKKRNNLSGIDMGTIGEIRTNYETGHPEYKKVLNKRAEIRNDA